MGIMNWFRRTSMRGSGADLVGESDAPDVVRRIEEGKPFAVEVAISGYGALFQACFELLMKKHGSGAPVLGDWSAAVLSCAGCERAFPSSFKLHLTNPGILGDRQPRSDCPDCGCDTTRVAYSPSAR